MRMDDFGVIALASGNQQAEQKADCCGDTDRLPRIGVYIFVGHISRFACFFARVLFGRMQRVFDFIDMIGQLRAQSIHMIVRMFARIGEYALGIGQ